MLPDYWQFYMPTRIVAGAGVLRDLENEILATGSSRPFLVTDRQIRAVGLVEKLASALGSLELVGIFDEVPANSEVSLVEKGAAAAREAGADILVTLGGGSCIDTAKAMNIVLSLGGTLLDYEGFGQINSPLRPLAAIPTTAGTGSESTQYAVILDGMRHTKVTFLSPHLTPAIAVLDPELTLSLPPSLTASTGMDALGHAMESYASTSGSPMARGLATEACAMIFDNLEKAVHNGDDLQARYSMLLASNMAGIAFSNSMVGCVHAMAHALGALKGVPHALAVGLMLPYGIKYNGEGEGFRIYDALAGMLLGKRGEGSPEMLAERISSLLEACGLPRRLRDIGGIEEEDLPSVAEEAAVDGAMYTNPREAGPEELLALLKKAF